MSGRRINRNEPPSDQHTEGLPEGRRQERRPLEAELPRREPDDGGHRPPEDDRVSRRRYEPYRSSYPTERRRRSAEASPEVAQYFGQKQRTSEQNAALRAARNKKRRRQSLLRTGICAFLLVTVLVLGVVAIWKGFAKKPPVQNSNSSESSSQQEGDQRDPNAPTRLSGDRKEDFYTFLIIGRDTVGGGNTDTILLASYDVPNQKMNVMNIPRDTMVNVSWDVKKINSVYNYYGGGDKGIAALDKKISELVGFVPDFQVIVELDAVAKLVDALGGVTFNVPCDMNKVTEDLVINLKAGEQKIDGHKAMQLIRFRGYLNADLGRMQTQQDFIKVVLQKVLSISSVPRMTELVKVFQESVTTNLKNGELAWFAQKAVLGGLSSENIFLATMPCAEIKVWSREYKHKLDYVLPKTDELIALVNERFNPYLEPLKPSELDIMHVNDDGTIGSSTGKLEDTRANQR